MSDMQTFPETVDEFMEHYKVIDKEGVYMSKGVELVPIFRMQQWFEHLGRKKGKWIIKPHKMMGEAPCCSECGMFEPMERNFCPNCGARMERKDGKMRLIDADALIKSFEDKLAEAKEIRDYFVKQPITMSEQPLFNEAVKAWEDGIGIARAMTTIEERKKGKWIDCGFPDEVFAEVMKCPFCGMESFGGNFCDYCGADMRGGGDG